MRGREALLILKITIMYKQPTQETGDTASIYVYHRDMGMSHEEAVRETARDLDMKQSQVKQSLEIEVFMIEREGYTLPENL